MASDGVKAAGAIAGIVSLILATPFIALFASFFRAAILFWPFMLLMGVLHSQPGWEWVPAVGWNIAFILMALVSFIFPTPSSASSKK